MCDTRTARTAATGKLGLGELWLRKRTACRAAAASGRAVERIPQQFDCEHRERAKGGRASILIGAGRPTGRARTRIWRDEVLQAAPRQAPGEASSGTWPSRAGGGCDKETLSRTARLRRTNTHDCVRHGTIDLFAAMSCWRASTRCTGRKRTRLAWLFFPQQFHGEVPKELDIHLIAGNYSTHNQAKLREWPSRRERLHVHFTPTAASWMNLVERRRGQPREREGSDRGHDGADGASRRESAAIEMEGERGGDSRQDSPGPPSLGEGR